MATEKRVIRYSSLARLVHWTNLVAILVLLVTGLALYVPDTNFLAGLFGSFNTSRLMHRLAVILLIIVPLIALPFSLRGAREWLGELFAWEDGDRLWILRFPIYLFRPSTEMPPVLAKMTVGQRVLTIVMLFGVLIQLITGSILLFRPAFTKSAILWASLFHDIGMLFIGVGLIFHVYVGLGGFKPYRSVWRGMLGDGTVGYKRAKHLWPKWTEEAPTVDRSK